MRICTAASWRRDQSASGKQDSSECLVRRDRLADGNYTYSNSNYTLTFTINSGGGCINKKYWALAQKYFGPIQGDSTYKYIENATLTNKSSGQVEKQTGGEMMKVSGSIWYQFQTPLCYYNFDVPNKRLKLQRFECKKDINYIKYTDENIILKKK